MATSIRLASDFACNLTVVNQPPDPAVTIDLAGHTLTGRIEVDRGQAIITHGTVTSDVDPFAESLTVVHVHVEGDIGGAGCCIFVEGALGVRNSVVDGQVGSNAGPLSGVVITRNVIHGGFRLTDDLEVLRFKISHDVISGSPAAGIAIDVYGDIGPRVTRPATTRSPSR